MVKYLRKQVNMDLITALENRRSIYGISKNSPISDERIIELVKIGVNHTPAAYNSQSQKVVVLFGEQHDKVWDIAMETLRKIVPEAQFAGTEKKINSFKAGYGTILYFCDDAMTEDLQTNFPLYKDVFPVWAQQQTAMLQLAMWTLLESEGLGATLQHYNPLIDEEVRVAFDLPKNWQLIGQMPFGTPTSLAGPKVFADIDERVKVFK